jgi:hypothetical protein
MRTRTFELAAILVALLIGALSVKAQANANTSEPPEIASGSDINYPINSVASGLVQLSVSLDASGQVKNVQTIREVPSLTAPALLAVNGWTFSAARLGGSPVESDMPVFIVFVPGILNQKSVVLEPAAKPQGTASSTSADFVAPKVSSAAYAVYPITSTATGAVVMNVRISRTGRVVRASAVYPVASLADSAISAAKAWRFTPARFRGMPIAWNAVIAYVFRSPTISTTP